MENKLKVSGASKDSIFLILVKIVTMVLGLAVTRILADTLTLKDYGTYSQVMLIVSTLTTLTVLGMVDGANYFFYNCKNVEEREKYISTIFTLQYIIGLISGLIIIAFSMPIIKYFNNQDLKNVLLFVVILPLLQNMISILQVLFIAIGKAKQIAIRNFLFSASRLILFFIACHFFNSIVAIFIFTVLLDIIQIIYFKTVLSKNSCKFQIRKTDLLLSKKIICYCAPMAAFLILSTLTRDCDRYVISAFTDTETLAVYTNAAKLLPFDIIMSSFCVVLLPYLTRYIVEEKYIQASNLYKSFLELSYITTSIFAGAAIATAPMLMRLLYSEKYLSGIVVFVIYIIVDIFRFTNMTLILSASGKTKSLMYISAFTLILNLILNLILFKFLGIIGPAISTLIVTIISGYLIQSKCIKILQSKWSKIFDFKYLCVFGIELISFILIFSKISKWLLIKNIYYLFGLLFIGSLFSGVMLVFNFKKILYCIRDIGKYKLNN